MADENDDILQTYFGGLDPSWTADSTDGTGTGRRYVTVPVTSLYAENLYGKYRGVRFDQGLVGWVRAPMFSAATGAPIVIDVGSYSTAPAVDVRIIEASGADPRVWEPDVAAELSSDGRLVQFEVPPEVADCAGVYRAQFRVVDSVGVERARDEFSLYVDRGLWTTDGGTPADRGPPTFAEVRTAVRDHPAANRLLGEYEFDPAEIGYAVVSAVQRYNHESPPLPRRYLLKTTSINGAFRRPILTGALSYLFETAATYFRRGHLPYVSGGLSVDDLAKDKDYTAALQALRAEFIRWVQLTRQSINFASGWGSTSSGMPNRPTF